MNAAELKELTRLAQMRLEHAQGQMARIAMRERNARAAIKDIDEAFETAATTPSEETADMRRLGAHQLWMDWTRKRRAELNRDLALILAEQRESAARLRTHLGKRDALQSLAKEALQAEQKKIEDLGRETILTNHTINSMFARR